MDHRQPLEGQGNGGAGGAAFGVEGHRAVFLAVVVEQGHLVDAGVKKPPPVLA